MNFLQKDSSMKFGIFFLIYFSLTSIDTQTSTPDKRTNLTQLFNSTIKSGERDRTEGDFSNAINAFISALSIAKKIGYEEGEVQCLTRLGLLYWNTGHLEESSKKYKQALSLAQTLNLKNKEEECQSAIEIYRLYKEGKEFRSSGECQKSIESFEKAIDLAKKSGSKEHELKCIRQMSFTYLELNKLKEFCSLHFQVLTIAQSLKHKKEEGRSLYNLGFYYQNLDNYSKALNFYEGALLIARDLNNKEDESDCLNNIGVIYEKIGNYDKALDCLKEAFKIYKLLLRDYVYYSMNNIGETFRKKGLALGNKKDFYKALDYFYDSLKLARKTKDKKAEVYVLNNIGTIQMDLGNYHKALNCFKPGYEKAKEIKDVKATGMILTNIGIVYFNQGDYEKAIESYIKAIKMVNELDGRQILWEAYFGLGQCHEKMNKFSQAVEYYKRAIDIIDHIRSQILLDTYKAGFARDKLKVYEFLINLLYRLSLADPTNSYDKEIFNIVERAKARAFLECLGEFKVDIKEKLSPELKKREKEISDRISLILQELSKAGLSKKRRKELLTKLQYEEEEYLSLISKIRVKNPEIASLVSLAPCQVEQVQKILDEKTVLIEYFLGESQSVVFFISKYEFDVYSLPSRREIERSIKAYLKILSDSPKGEFRGIPAAKRIYKELLFPSKKNIPESVENLIIVPDGVLYYLPFETLVHDTESKFPKNEYLIANYKISYAPSSSVLLSLSEYQPNHKSPRGLLAFGNPSYTLKVFSKRKGFKTYLEILRELYLSQGFDFSSLPYSEREVLKISKYFPKEKRTIYLNDEAKEEIVKKIPLKNYQIIHFACHGFLDEGFPFRSALVLSMDEDPQEDGFLQVREIYNLSLKAGLIVLSACQTGKGKLEKGEGILGLPRIFFYIGAKSVVLTLWRISDKCASTFMNSFYYYLTQGNDKAQALRLAKLKMINSKFSHPFYWAPFILNGESNSTVNFE